MNSWGLPWSGLAAILLGLSQWQLVAATLTVQLQVYFYQLFREKLPTPRKAKDRQLLHEWQAEIVQSKSIQAAEMVLHIQPQRVVLPGFKRSSPKHYQKHPVKYSKNPLSFLQDKPINALKPACSKKIFHLNHLFIKNKRVQRKGEIIY